jgi:hypothetical protein
VLAEGNEAAEVVEEGIDGLLGRRMRRHGGYMVGEDGACWVTGAGDSGVGLSSVTAS